ncbi:MAG: hypothetical protein ACR2IF_03905 [Terriglobales bacterium]
MRTRVRIRMQGIASTTLLLVIVVACSTTHAQKNTPPPKSIAPSSHSATLRWDASPETKNKKAHITYKVYRSSGTHSVEGKTDCGKDFQPIATVKAPATEYIDKEVTAGQVYCYRVTTVRSGAESPPTPTIVATIPAEKTQ